MGTQQRKHAFDTLAAARQWRTERQKEMGDGSYVEPSKLTVGDLLQRVIDADRGRLEENTLLLYANRRNQLVALHDVLVQRLTLARLAQWQTAALTGPRPYAKSTVAGALGFLKKAMRFAVRSRLVTRNPFDEFDIVVRADLGIHY